jgi:hypothetical protein
VADKKLDGGIAEEVLLTAFEMGNGNNRRAKENQQDCHHDPQQGGVDNQQYASKYQDNSSSNVTLRVR